MVYSHFVNSHTVNSHLVNFHLVNFHFVNFHLVNFYVVNVDKVGIDKVGKLTILYTFNYCYRSGKFLAHQSNLLSGECMGDETAVNLSSFQNLKSLLYCSRLQRFPTLPQIQEEIEFRGE